MKNKSSKNIFLYSIILLIIISSCSKHKDDEIIPTQQNCLLTVISDWNTGDTVQTFTYNQQKQIIQTQDYTNGVKSTYNTYQYTSSTVTKIDYNANKTVLLKAVYFLNSSNAVRQGFFYGADNKIQGELACTYNTNGQAILEVYKYGDLTSGTFSNVDSSTFYYANDNEVRVRNIQTDPTVVDTIDTYYTYTNLIDKSHIRRGGVLIPGFYGKDNKNIVAQKAIPKLNIAEHYSYELDANGYVDRSTMNTSKSSVDLKYSYMCD